MMMAMVDADTNDLQKWRVTVDRRLQQIESGLVDVVDEQKRTGQRVDTIEEQQSLLRESNMRLREDVVELKRNACAFFSRLDFRSLATAIILLSGIIILYRALVQ
jgi:hypothetical protein